jgi:tyrosine-specific transport protein
MKSKLFSAIVILTGTVVGAGIFGIPYVVAKVGFISGLVYLIVLGLVVAVEILCYGEVILRTKEFHQSTGYAEKYLGKWGKLVMSFSLVFGIYGALLAYMIGVGDFLYSLIGEFLGGTPVLYATIFFILASLAILVGLGMVIKIEKGMFLVLLAVVLLIFVLGVRHVQFDNLIAFDLKNIFLPYGVILFAFTGISAIPDMSRTLRREESKLKKAIMIGMVTVFVVYLLFSFVIVGISGKNTSEEAVVGLEKLLGKKIFIIGAILGILTMATSFLTLGLALKEMFVYDFGFHKTLAWVVACFVPFIFFLLGLVGFVRVLGIVGSITGGISGILVFLMYFRAKKTGDQKPAYTVNIPKILVYFLCGLFGLGAIYQIYYLVFK